MWHYYLFNIFLTLIFHFLLYGLMSSNTELYQVCLVLRWGIQCSALEIITRHVKIHELKWKYSYYSCLCPGMKLYRYILFQKKRYLLMSITVFSFFCHPKWTCKASKRIKLSFYDTETFMKKRELLGKYLS